MAEIGSGVSLPRSLRLNWRRSLPILPKLLIDCLSRFPFSPMKNSRPSHVFAASISLFRSVGRRSARRLRGRLPTALPVPPIVPHSSPAADPQKAAALLCGCGCLVAEQRRAAFRWTWFAHSPAQETRVVRRAQRSTPPAAESIQDIREPPGKVRTLPPRSERRSPARNPALFPPATCSGLQPKSAVRDRYARTTPT